MAKTVARKKSADTPDTNRATSDTPTPAQPKRAEPYVTKIEEGYSYSVRLHLNTGEKLDLLAAGGGSFEALKEIRALALTALQNSVK